MKCPKCKEQELKKKSFDAPQCCPNCGGIWLEFAKIPTFVEPLEPASPAHTDASLHDGKTGLCPEGHGIMRRAKIDIEPPFYLEKCAACGGIWFDDGEWQRIVNSKLTDQLNEFWCSSWQAKQRQQKSRQTYLDTNRKMLGDELFEELISLAEKLKDHPEKGRAMALLQQEVLK